MQTKSFAMKEIIIFTIVLSVIMIFFYLLTNSNFNKISRKNNILGETIKLHVGDKFFIEVTMNSDKIVNLKLIDSVKDSSITIKISFTYEKIKGNVGYFSVLQINNPFSKTICYTESIKRTTKNTCDEPIYFRIEPKNTSCNLWPFNIEFITITDLKFE